MNKAILASLVILCLLSMPFLMECELSVKASPKIWTVDKDGTADFKTIQEAINNAASGDTIFVHNGTYYEHVNVNKTVALVGEDRESTIINGNETGSVISITADNVSIEGFTVERSGTVASGYDSGIFVDHSSGNNISLNTVENNYYGISLHSCTDNTVSDNTVEKNYYGISLYSCTDNTVSDNTITNRYYGITLHTSNNNIISDNTVENNYYGITFHSSENNVISGNTISSNDYDGVSFHSSKNNVISGNTISSNNYTGLILYSSSNNMVSDNTIEDSKYGISLTDSSSNMVFHNNFINNTEPPYSYNSINVWDDGYRSGGNYWSDYAGVDLYKGPYQNETGCDGMGDTPHSIDANNQDNHSFMGMFSDFTVTLERGRYHVPTICNSTISEFRFEIGSETGNEIIRLDVTGKDDTVGFCRVAIPIKLMNYPYIVLVDVEEVVPTLLEEISNETCVCLYFAYNHSRRTITITSSKALHLYYDLETELDNLNATHHDLLNNYSELQNSHQELNNSYQELLSDYSEEALNIRNLTYIFAVTTAIFIITIIYLSKHAHASKTKGFEGTQKKETL